MQIKVADDKQPQTDLLGLLLARPDVVESTRKKIEQEIWAIRAGAKSESEAAYEIEFQFGNSEHVMTLHDLRLEVGGRVAQMDHLIVNRFFQIWVCESKSFSEGVSINEQGEWSSYRGRRPYGIASPIEQNKRHMAVLKDVFAKGLVTLPKRLGLTLKPSLESLVLISNRAHISRPKGLAASRINGLNRVIKCEQLTTTIDKMLDKKDTVDMAVTIMSVVSRQTIERLARELAALHSPATFDWAAKFGLPASPTASAETNSTIQPQAKIRRSRPIGARAPAAGTTKAITCQSCGIPVSEAVVAYCLVNVARFSGRLLCMTCQRNVARG